MSSRLYYPKAPSLAMDANAPPPPSTPGGDAVKKIVQLIPTEIITGYAGLVSAAVSLKWLNMRGPALCVIFALCWILTPLYLNSVADADKPKRNQLIVGTLAFPVWVYIVSGNQVVPGIYDPSAAAIVAVVFSMITSFIPMNK
jgi:hypothetical protein